MVRTMMVGAQVGLSGRRHVSRAVLRDTLSPRRQRASPGMASGPKLRKRAGVVRGEKKHWV